MVSSSQHALAKYLGAAINLILQLYSNNCIKDSFTFVKKIYHHQNALKKKTLLCSFNIRSLFINVLLAETIPIDADVLYGGELIPPDYVNDTFAIFRSEEEFTSFLDALNSMHLALKFTFGKEENDQLSFLDVLVEKSNEGFLTSAFGKIIMKKPNFY